MISFLDYQKTISLYIDYRFLCLRCSAGLLPTKNVQIVTFLYEKLTDRYFSVRKSYKSLLFPATRIIIFSSKKGTNQYSSVLGFNFFERKIKIPNFFVRKRHLISKVTMTNYAMKSRQIINFGHKWVDIFTSVYNIAL